MPVLFSTAAHDMLCSENVSRTPVTFGRDNSKQGDDVEKMTVSASHSNPAPRVITGLILEVIWNM